MIMRCPNCGREISSSGRHCICMLEREYEIPTSKIKEPRSLGEFTITVDKTELNEALEKARELVGVLEKIDGLTGRITRDIDKINRYALGKQI